MEKSFCPYCMSRVIPGESCPQCGLTAGNYVPSPHHLPPGTVLLGRYLVGRALGEGGFGITYIGYDLRLELKVAIKEYYPVDRATRNSAVSLSVTSFVGPSSQSFQRGKEKYLVEARAMAKMDKQQAIVSVRDFFEENNTAYIVMEYIDGTTFCDLVKQRGRIPPGELFPLLEPLFGDLALMHEHGLIHRDISPDNLMLEHGVVRLLDFGCARESTRGTETLTIALKQGYAPVEQYQQKGQGPWTDIYALCATIYFCLTGKAPPQALDRITADGLVPPSKLGVPIPPGQEAALLKGLRLSPGRRFRSMEEFHGALYSPQPPSFPEDPEDADEEEDSPAIRQEQDTPPATQEPEEQRRPVVTQEVPPQPTPLWKRWQLWIAAAAVPLVVLAAVLAPIDRQAGTPVSSAGAPSGEGASAVSLEEEGLNRQVRLIPSLMENSLRNAMTDASVEEVVLEEGAEIYVFTQPLEVTKRLVIPAGAQLIAGQLLTVTGEGSIQVEGLLSVECCVVQGEGAISVEEGGTLTGGGILFLEREASLQAAQTATVELAGQPYGQGESSQRFPVVDEEALFANAVPVSSLEEWQQALQDPSTQAIQVTGDLELPPEGISHTIPVRVNEGVTVTVQESDGANAGPWYADGALVLNRGTILADFQTAGESGRICCVLNYGTIAGAFHMDCPGNLLNFGELHISQAQFLQTNLWNLGDLALEAEGEESYLHLLSETGGNFGTVTVGQQAVLTLECPGTFFNGGSVEVAGGTLENHTHLRFGGSLDFSQAGSLFDNSGLLEMVSSTASWNMHPESEWRGAGVAVADGTNPITLPDGADESNLVMYHWDDTARHVKTEEELREALADEDTALVVLEGEGPLTLTEDLTVTKQLLADTGLVMASGNLTVSGTGAFLRGSLDLGVGTLTVEQGAIVWSDSYANFGSVHVSGGLLVNSGELTLTGESALTLAEQGSLVNLGFLHFQEAVWAVQDASLFSWGWLDMAASTLEVGEGGFVNLRAFGTALDEASTVVNRGNLSLYAYQDGDSFTLAGTLQNEGELSLGAATLLAGTMENQGTVRVLAGLRVQGSLRNLGLVETVGCQVEAEGDGSITGNPAQPAAE